MSRQMETTRKKKKKRERAKCRAGLSRGVTFHPLMLRKAATVQSCCFYRKATPFTLKIATMMVRGRTGGASIERKMASAHGEEDGFLCSLST